jgi:hypothetical protein
MYGLRDTSFGPPGIIGAIEATPAGNVALRIGNPNEPKIGGWHQTEYVVLPPVEAREVAAELIAHVGFEASAEVIAEAKYDAQAVEALRPILDPERELLTDALAVLITDPTIRAHIDPRALAQAREALRLPHPREVAKHLARQQYPEATDTGAQE